MLTSSGPTAYAAFCEFLLYPIVSTLRRFSSHVIFVSPEAVSFTSGAASLTLETASSYLSATDGSWHKAGLVVPITEVIHPGVDAIEASILATSWENDLASKARIGSMLFTLLLGPETLQRTSEGVDLTTRLAVVRGIYRAVGTQLRPAHVNSPTISVFSATPQGAVIL